MFQIRIFPSLATFFAAPMLMRFLIAHHFLRASGKTDALIAWSSWSFLMFCFVLFLSAVGGATLQQILAFSVFNSCVVVILLIWLGGSLLLCFLFNKKLPTKKEVLGLVLAAVVILTVFMTGNAVALQMRTAAADAFQKELQKDGAVVVDTTKAFNSEAVYCKGVYFIASVKIDISENNTEVFRWGNVFYLVILLAILYSVLLDFFGQTDHNGRTNSYNTQGKRARMLQVNLGFYVH